MRRNLCLSDNIVLFANNKHTFGQPLLDWLSESSFLKLIEWHNTKQES